MMYSNMKNMNVNVFILLLFLQIGYTVMEEGWFWHVTDLHWDFTYSTGQLSCNGANISNPGRFGNQWCDSPWTLVQEATRGMRDVKQDVDFILWTGDSVPHIDSDHLSTEINKELVKNITTLMKVNFPNISIYATFGNHDYYRTNLFPPHENEIYNATYDIWKAWINDQSQDINFLKGGYYTVVTSHGLRIVALNTNMYYYKDTATQHLEDPAGQFVWLDSVLSTAKKNTEKVIITGHVPPGFTTPRAVRWMSPAFNTRLIDIVTQHSDIIVAMHFGHEHHDNFRLFYDTHGLPLVSLFIAPSITPWRYQIPSGIEPPHNPGARLIKYDRQTGAHLDMMQYYVDIDNANRANTLTWILGYNATSLYGIPDITAASMGTVVRKMANMSGSEFKSYVNWYNTNAVKDYPCNVECHRSVICGIKHLEELKFKACLSSVSNSSTSIVYNMFILITCYLTFALGLYAIN